MVGRYRPNSETAPSDPHVFVCDNGLMSWDIFVQQLPDDVRAVSEMPNEFVPEPLGARSDIVSGIRDVFPTVDFSDPEWGRIDEEQFSIEINISADDPVRSFALHVRGDSSAAQAVAALLDRLRFRALDPQSPTGIFDAPAAYQSFDGWRDYRDQVIERQH